jgi:hypothetical protein
VTDINPVEVVSAVCGGIGVFVGITVKLAMAQLELRIIRAIDEASGKQAKFVEQARRAASTSLQMSRENRTAISYLKTSSNEQKNCISELERRFDAAGMAR